MKYVTVPYVAIGLMLSLAIGVEYDCKGPEMFPTYYGSPFVFKEKSLGSSMEYFYSISGLVLNVAVWSIMVVLVRRGILSLTEKTGNRAVMRGIYKGGVVLMVVFTTLSIAIDWVMLGRGFEKGRNYWYMQMDKEAKDWGMKCEGELVMFRK
jgi:hypothetical protein